MYFLLSGLQEEENLLEALPEEAGVSRVHLHRLRQVQESFGEDKSFCRSPS